MKNKHYYIAFDIGATSGRSILGTLQEGKLEIEELTRFPNRIHKIQGRFCWDIYTLFNALKDGLKVAGKRNIQLDAIGIDTWGVDFVYLAEDGTILNQPRSYRDSYTDGIPYEYFKLIPHKEVYDLTGIQIMNFNTLFQLFAAKKECSSALNHAKEILFMPDALSYLLTGSKVCEYTIASTSQLVNPRTKRVENKLLEAIDIAPSIMRSITMPGQKIALIANDIARECGIAPTPVVAVAGHDTGSAVVAVPADNENFAYISSGTWSLMGIEVKEPIINENSFAMNFTNEGGVDGTIRFLKNITGMWLLEQCRKEWDIAGRNYNYMEIEQLSGSIKGFDSLVDPDDPSFSNPDKMTTAIAAFCENHNQKIPRSDAEFIHCIFNSLALKYKYVLSKLKEIAPFPIHKLYVIGGGSQNKLLNQLTANAVRIPVIAGPSEATAIGNILVQAKGVGLIDSLDEMRTIVRNSVVLEIFEPQEDEAWRNGYDRFLQIITQ